MSDKSPYPVFPSEPIKHQMPQCLFCGQVYAIGDVTANVSFLVIGGQKSHPLEMCLDCVKSTIEMLGCLPNVTDRAAREVLNELFSKSSAQ